LPKKGRHNEAVGINRQEVFMSQFILSGFADEAAADLSGQIQALQANRLTAVDLRAVDGVNIADFTPDKARAVRDALAGARLETACLASPIGKIDITDPFEPHLDKLQRLCEIARILNCLRIRIFSFYIPAGHSAGSCRSAVLERLDRLLTVAGDAGIRLLHENEKNIYGDTAERCLDLHQTFGARLGGILDPANYLQVGSDPLAAMQNLDSWIEYLHIKDVRLSDQKIVPAGQGDGRIRQILAIYAARPERQHVAVEPHLYSFAGLAKLERPPEHGSGSATGQDGTAGPEVQALAAFSTAIAACRELLPE
jgi:sugar phosphate isomerase/epimerase